MTPAPPHRIVLGDNNVWALPRHVEDGGGWLLVDAGIDYVDESGRTTWDALVEQASAAGFSAAEVRLVVVTHEHIDHAGMSARWAAEGARIICGSAAVSSLIGGRASNEAQRGPRLAELRRHGVPDDVIEHLAVVRGRRGLRWDPCLREAIDLAEERAVHRLADGRSLHLVPAPGHTPGNLVAYVEESRDLFSGDTVLPTTIPTPGLHFPEAVEGDAAAPRWPSLPPFLRSVQAIRGLGAERVYPGHGEVVEEPSRLLDQFEAHHARRGRRVREALAALERPTAFEVARSLFPRLPVVRLGQAMTEVLGHLDLLEERGEAQRADGEPVRWIEVAPAR